VIAVDWGTTSCRAYRLRAGAVIDRREARAGILQIASESFASALRDLVGPWLADGERRVVLGGMIGSRSGWVETPYVPCPASSDDLARQLVAVAFDGAAVRVVPGVSATDPAGTPEFIRGEEAQIFGTDVADGVVCLPGSHSKWVRVTERRIATFTTFLTGETFSALRAHTILAKSIVDAPIALDAFDAGIARSAEPGGLLHHLFGVRALALTGRLGERTSGSYLSGLLIGHEVRQALVERESVVHVVGAAELTDLYARAILSRGGRSRGWSDETAAIGLNRIAEQAPWT
jgi:2-dehydro-3-deoxygalactonokinase